MKTKQRESNDRSYKEVIRDVRDKIDVKKLLDYYGLAYKPRKDELVMKCIFHEKLMGKADNNPSFSINVNSKLYNCLSCPAGGNVFQFIMQLETTYGDKESCSFYDSVVKACEIFGIEIDGLFKVSKDDINFDSSMEEILIPQNASQQEVFNEKVLEKFYLKSHRYFLDRKFLPETLKYFEMGFGAKAGDTNVDRCVFPVRNVCGKLVGWTGRTVKENVQPKWLHQPADRFFTGLNLFNIDKALNHIHNSGDVYVVESVANCMRLSENGHKNVVAILGNQMSEYQSDMLCEHADRIFLLFDNDAGGIDGIMIAINMLYHKGKEIFIGLFDFGIGSDGKAIDVGDADANMLKKIRYVDADTYIEQNKKVVDILLDGFSKNGTIVDLPNGDSLLCVEKVKKGEKMVQITENDYNYIKRIDNLFGIEELVIVPF